MVLCHFILFPYTFSAVIRIDYTQISIHIFNETPSCVIWCYTAVIWDCVVLDASRLCLSTLRLHQCSTVGLSRRRKAVSRAWSLTWLLIMPKRNLEPRSCWREAYMPCRRMSSSTGTAWNLNVTLSHWGSFVDLKHEALSLNAVCVMISSVSEAEQPNNSYYMLRPRQVGTWILLTSDSKKYNGTPLEVRFCICEHGPHFPPLGGGVVCMWVFTVFVKG